MKIARILRSALLLLGASAFAADSIPLEWNVNRKSDVPYEIEIDTAKIAKITGKSSDAGFAIVAKTSSGAKELPVTALAGNSTNKILLRFTVPSGTTSLECVPGKGELKLTPASDCGNLFSGALTDPAKWQYGYKAGSKIKRDKLFKLTRKDGALYFDVARFGTYVARYTVDIPESLAGKHVMLEFTLQSAAKMVWRNPIRVIQYDAEGKELPVSVTDPRWISHMRPPETKTRYSEPGIIHSEARKITFELTFIAPRLENDNHGLPLKDKTANQPKLLLSELALREAHQLPFPRYRDELFAAGFSGKSGDFSHVLNGNNLFFFATSGHGSWAEENPVRDINSSYYPLGDGTIECCFKPEKWDNTAYILMQATNRLNRSRKGYLPKRGELFCVQYIPKSKRITVSLKDFADKKFYKSAKAEIPVGKWSHIAVQWSQSNGVQVYLNGKKIIDDKKYKFTPVDPTASPSNYVNAHQLTVGNTVAVSRGSGTGIKNNFRGKIDLLRVSSAARYTGNFTPAKSFTSDPDTRALFNFDRNFDGTTYAELQFISGSSLDKAGRRNNKISYAGSEKQYFPPEILDEVHHDKVLNRLNYPVVPREDDFNASYTSHSKSFSASNGDEFEINVDKDVRVDSIEYTNTSDKDLKHPIIIADGEIDPRSFGDIADTLDLRKTSHRDRANRIFNFVLGASDYFMNHQIDFAPKSNKPRSAEYLALVMLNSYCGFECGPLNNLAATLFSCSGQLPAVQTGGFGHSFEQVFYDGKNRLYDLSAQKFFPAFDNEGAVSLGESGIEPGVYGRTGGSSDHFIRLSLRGHSVNSPEFMEKIGVTIKSGESFKVFHSNDGTYNDIQMSGALGNKKMRDIERYNKKLNIPKSKHPLYRIPRVFPHFASAFLRFNAAPAKHKSAFSKITAKDFRYTVDSSYVIVSGEYLARLADGKAAKIELSIDGGKTFRKLKAQKDGSYSLRYEVNARHNLVFKINAPISEVKNFKASTKVMVNPRVLTAKLKKGNNKLTFKSTSGKAQVKIAYSTKAFPIKLTGVVSHGGIPGYARQFTVVEPGKSAEVGISGVSENASVSATDGVSAELKQGKIIIKAPADKKRYFAQVIIRDRSAEKRIHVLIAPGVRLLTPAQAKLSGNAKLIKAEGQDCIFFPKPNAKAVFDCTLPAGKYQIWNLNRFESHVSANHGSGGHGKSRFLQMQIDGKQYGIGSTGNTCSDFYKAQFAKQGERSRFKWDFPLSSGTTYPYHRPEYIKIGSADKITVFANEKRKVPGGAELAALLVVPDCEVAFLSELVRHLCGLNNEVWKIKESNAVYFK